MSIVFSFGKWTKPYLFRSSVYGLCLGFVTVTLVRAELTDVVIEGMFPDMEPLRHNNFFQESGAGY